MRYLIIFSFFVCFAAANFISSEHPKLLMGQYQEKEKLVVKQCAREYNIDENKYYHFIGQEAMKKNPNEAWCMMACGFRRMLSKEVTVLDPMKTLYNGFMKIIEQAYQAGFQEFYDGVETDAQDGFTRESVTNKIEQCYASEKNECDFFKCSETYNGPVAIMLIYGAQRPVENPVYSPEW